MLRGGFLQSFAGTDTCPRAAGIESHLPVGMARQEKRTFLGARYPCDLRMPVRPAGRPWALCRGRILRKRLVPAWPDYLRSRGHSRGIKSVAWKAACGRALQARPSAI